MPYAVNIGEPPSGYAAKSARTGEQFNVIFREFTSTEDGQYFIHRLEGLPTILLQTSPNAVKQSQVDNMLAIIRNNGDTTVYLNEIVLRVIVRSAGPIEEGANISEDDIADIESLDLEVHIPDDAGLLFLFSVGWRKGLFFDYGPIYHEPRTYDVGAILGQVIAHVWFQERFSITDDEWASLFADRWFPFKGLRSTTIDKLINCVRSGWGCDEMLDEIISEVASAAPQMLENWKKRSSLAPHIAILERAVERFLCDDAMSATALLFPRIEGILRTHNADTQNNSSQDTLAQLAVEAKIANDSSLLLPRRFHTYLRDVYFAHFDPGEQNIPVSRNSIGHGVANAFDFNPKSAVLGILIIHQLFYLLSE